jgi:cbb3-type cytochrome oxidase subunit 3
MIMSWLYAIYAIYICVIFVIYEGKKRGAYALLKNELQLLNSVT